MQTPRILSGAGCLESLKDLIEGPSVIVSDRGLSEAGIAPKVQGILGSEEFLGELEGEPTAAVVDATADRLRKRGAVTVIGVGGGSSLDLAKLAAVVARADQSADHYDACANPLPESLPLILIPTTAGTGSEMSRTAVFTNSQGEKTWAWGDEMQANIAVLEPKLTRGLPIGITVLTAVDALSHALEAAVAVNQNSITNPLCHQAGTIIPKALGEVLKKPDNLEARERLLNASGLAGMGLNSCGTGLAHALAHALATLVKVPHGLAIAWSLRVTLEWNPKELYAGFSWLKESPYENLSRWLDTLPIPSLPKFDAQALAQRLQSTENLPMMENNPRSINAEQALALSERLRSYC